MGHIISRGPTMCLSVFREAKHVPPCWPSRHGISSPVPGGTLCGLLAVIRPRRAVVMANTGAAEPDVFRRVQYKGRSPPYASIRGRADSSSLLVTPPLVGGVTVYVVGNAGGARGPPLSGCGC